MAVGPQTYITRVRGLAPMIRVAGGLPPVWRSLYNVYNLRQLHNTLGSVVIDGKIECSKLGVRFSVCFYLLRYFYVT